MLDIICQTNLEPIDYSIHICLRKRRSYGYCWSDTDTMGWALTGAVYGNRVFVFQSGQITICYEWGIGDGCMWEGADHPSTKIFIFGRQVAEEVSEQSENWVAPDSWSINRSVLLLPPLVPQVSSQDGWSKEQDNPRVALKAQGGRNQQIEDAAGDEEDDGNSKARSRTTANVARSL